MSWENPFDKDENEAISFSEQTAGFEFPLVHYLRNNYQVCLMLQRSENVINIRLFFSFIRYSFDNIFVLPPSSSWTNERRKYKIEYKSVLCQFHSIAIFARLFPLKLLGSSPFLVSFFLGHMTGSSCCRLQIQNARDGGASVVYWVKLSMKYFDNFNNSLLLWADCAAVFFWNR